jgi:hypothetical protein
VTVTDGNGCSDTESAIVNQFAGATADITGDLTICQGETTTLTATGGTSYKWSTSAMASFINVNTSGTYTVTATDANGCTDVASETVVVNPLPTADIMGNLGINPGDMTTLTATGGTMYLWNTNEITAEITVSDFGTYSVTVTGVNECTDVASVVVFDNSAPSFDLTGTILWEHNDDPVQNVACDLTGISMDNDNTDANGDFTVSSKAGAATITPSKNVDLFLGAGLDVGDALSIQKYLTGMYQFEDVYEFIAADVNQNDTVTLQDAVLLYQSLRGNPVAISKIPESWRFVPTDYVFPNPLSPWGFPEERTLQVAGPAINLDFIGIKIGDINGGTDASLRPSDDQTLTWRIQDRILKTDEVVSVQFTAGQFKDLQGFQFSLAFDTTQLAFENVEMAETTNWLTVNSNFGLFNLHEGKIRTLWTGSENKSVDYGTEVFTLHFKARAGGMKLSEVLQLDNQVLRPVAFNEWLDPVSVNLTFYGLSTVGTQVPGEEPSELVLLQNTPNPFDNKTQIGFYLPESTEVNLSVFDGIGKLVYSSKAFYLKGWNNIDLTGDELKGTGTLYYRIQTPLGSDAKKMLHLNR